METPPGRFGWGRLNLCGFLRCRGCGSFAGGEALAGTCGPALMFASEQIWLVKPPLLVILQVVVSFSRVRWPMGEVCWFSAERGSGSRSTALSWPVCSAEIGRFSLRCDPPSATLVRAGVGIWCLRDWGTLWPKEAFVLRRQAFRCTPSAAPCACGQARPEVLLRPPRIAETPGLPRASGMQNDGWFWPGWRLAGGGGANGL